MKKLTLTIIAVVCLGMVSANARAACGTCAGDEAKAKAAVAKCDKSACPMGGILAKLDLSKDQQAEIDKVRNACDCTGVPPKDKEARKAWAAKRKKCQAKIRSILTPEQRKKWAEIRKAARQEKAEKTKKVRKNKKAE